MFPIALSLFADNSSTHLFLLPVKSLCQRNSCNDRKPGTSLTCAFPLSPVLQVGFLLPGFAVMLLGKEGVRLHHGEEQVFFFFGSATWEFGLCPLRNVGVDVDHLHSRFERTPPPVPCPRCQPAHRPLVKHVAIGSPHQTLSFSLDSSNFYGKLMAALLPCLYLRVPSWTTRATDYRKLNETYCTGMQAPISPWLLVPLHKAQKFIPDG